MNAISNKSIWIVLNLIFASNSLSRILSRISLKMSVCTQSMTIMNPAQASKSPSDAWLYLEREKAILFLSDEYRENVTVNYYAFLLHVVSFQSNGVMMVISLEFGKCYTVGSYQTPRPQKQGWITVVSDM